MEAPTTAAPNRNAGSFHRLAFVDQKISSEFCEFGIPIFDSEELTNAVYTAFVALIKERFECQHGLSDLSDFGMLYRHGAYMACERRVALVGELDLVNDTLPDFCALTGRQSNDPDSFYTARRVEKLPTGVAPIRPGDYYRLACISETNDTDLRVLPSHFVSIDARGRITHCIDRRIDYAAPACRNAWYAVGAAIALWAHADRRFLWQVRTSEKLLGGAYETGLTLGVNPEMVKSLFYARQAPLTDTGRRRPILHWVQAHQRRLRDGIEIDIREHLRGVTRFEMDSMTFEITAPAKAA